ncbi:MAG: alpha/beta hydrolase [Bacteroidales bacterium]|nr:alpha/beta hydrolase [Bacteroidales bacterium]
MKKTAIIMVLLTVASLAATAQSRYRIWPKGSGVEARKVTVAPYIAEGSKTAVIVCPGGSYCWLAYKSEGKEVAEWLQKNGISAFVLKYRVAGWWAWFTHYRLVFRGHQYPDMYNDAQMALLWVKEHSGEYGIDTAKIGMIGFSAGGHLVMSQVCIRGLERPAFVAPMYPVVSMAADCTHTRSRRGALGEYRKKDEKMRDSLSLERHVPKDCPPVFLVNCVDDPIVDYHNSELLDSALTAQGVRHRYIQYKTGGHGFGASDKRGTEESRQWRGEFLRWLKEIGMR